MASIVVRSLAFRDGDVWIRIAATAKDWAAGQDFEWRDAIVLVPFAQHLGLARRAWAIGGSWLPRIETTQTLARGLAPPEAGAGGQITFDSAVDRLIVRRMLRAQPWAAAWARHDRRGFESGVGAVTTTAHAIA